MTATTETCTCQNAPFPAEPCCSDLCQPLTQVALAVTLTCPGDYSLTLNTDGDCTQVLNPCPEPEPEPEPEPGEPIDGAFVDIGRINDFTETVDHRLLVAGSSRRDGGKERGWLARFSPDYKRVEQRIFVEGLQKVMHCTALDDGRFFVANAYSKLALLDQELAVQRHVLVAPGYAREIAQLDNKLYVLTADNESSYLMKLTPELSEASSLAVKFSNIGAGNDSKIHPLPTGEILVSHGRNQLSVFDTQLNHINSVTLPKTISRISVDSNGEIYLSCAGQYVLKLDSDLKLLSGIKHNLNQCYGCSVSNGQLVVQYMTSTGSTATGIVQLHLNSDLQLTGGKQLHNPGEDVMVYLNQSGHLSNGDFISAGSIETPYQAALLVDNQPVISDPDSWQITALELDDFNPEPYNTPLVNVVPEITPVTVTLKEHKMETGWPFSIAE